MTTMDAPELFLPPSTAGVERHTGPRGPAQRVGKAELEKLTGLHERVVRNCINELITKLGRRVCSTYGAAGQAGYYLPADEREALEAAEALKRHALTILRRAAVLEKRTVDLAIASLPRLAPEEDAA